jgi:hypothetical protein
VRQRFLADRYFLAWTKLLGDAGRFSAPPRWGRI